ncbi:phosphatidylinositol-specific phospholipase C domain-containing protein [Pyxidicoccus xibeiensis]|uniref:phosphatidylinositol-specific phospholipase C domain-containing protein n=1 Tax=Pyxidicoccus xibeiensis TaxID=2906759 RepID=UPI0020A72437|nr:phosphatidylinositol-specific phospholipase C domain-containing protein [Pyxidicoccus xibeiensis]MCP3142623.1 phosphatidylinositol-specific phospholipase C domain-containing protein [Pyxidicoccus xibeiensis]
MSPYPRPAVRPRDAALFLVLGLLTLALPASAGGRYYNHSGSIETSHPSWMAAFPDSTSLAAMSLPGTHDTMAFTNAGGDLTQTQSLNLRAQLDAGIRALDIRCRHIDNAFAIHHGVVYLNVNFTDVLNTAIQFLNANPRETLVMRVKKEHTEENVTRTFAQTFEWYRDQPAFSPYIWRGSHVPTLGEARGKIVILDDFAGGAYGIRWSALDLQDDWTVSTVFDIDDKWNKVRAHLERTNTGSPSTLYVNFLSGSSAGAFPYVVAGGAGSVARGVNDFAIDYLVGANVQRAGILMMDFPGAGLVDAILALNYRLLPASSSLPADLSTIFRNISYTLGGNAENRWNGVHAFVHNAAPGRNWHVMALKQSWGAWMNYDGTFLQSDSMDGYTHLAFTSRTVTSAVSRSYLEGYVNGQLSSLSGSSADRATQLFNRVKARFPFQSWSVVVKQAPGGLSNWAYSDYGMAAKLTLGDYTYAVQGYSAQDGVYLYEHVNFEGNVLRLTSNVAHLGSVGFDDSLSSIRILGPYLATFCEHPDLTGRCFSTSTQLSNVGSAWNDVVTSVAIQR